MGLEFVYTQPVKICFGAGVLERLDRILEEQGLSRCVAVCDLFLRPAVERLASQICHSEPVTDVTGVGIRPCYTAVRIATTGFHPASQ